MNYVQIILLISIVVVLLLLVDIYRRSKRKKYKQHLAELELQQQEEKRKFAEEQKQKEAELAQRKLAEQAEQSKPKMPKTDFEALSQGYAILNISAPRGYVFNGSDLNRLFTGYSIKLNDEGAFQFLTDDGNVLFTIVPSEEIGVFDKAKLSATSTNMLIAVMNIHKLKALNYDLPVCYDFFFNTINDLNTHLGGMLLNENETRYTESCDKTYRNVVKVIDSRSLEEIKAVKSEKVDEVSVEKAEDKMPVDISVEVVNIDDTVKNELKK